jgi:O-acetyl-ADP-ribose deacetylase (regulator of RNase III)
MAIKIVKGDITKIKVGAIVNATDREMSGKGGVDGAIHKAAGPELLEECEKLGGCKTGEARLYRRLRTGEAKITKGYKLPAKYVIHTVGPVYGKENGREAELLANCYANCLKLAKENGINSIAFPAISTSAYGYPKVEAAQIAIKTVKDFCDLNPDIFDEIIFVCFDDENLHFYKNLAAKQF